MLRVRAQSGDAQTQRVKHVDTVAAQTQPHTPVRHGQHGVDVRIGQAGRTARAPEHGVNRRLPGVETADGTDSTDPDQAGAIGVYGLHRIIRQTGHQSWIVADAARPQRCSVYFNNPVAVSPEPDRAGADLGNRVDSLGLQGGLRHTGLDNGPRGVLLEINQIGALPDSANPHSPLAVLEETPSHNDLALSQWYRSKAGRPGLTPHHSPGGAHPERTLAITKHGADPVVGQAVGIGSVVPQMVDPSGIAMQVIETTVSGDPHPAGAIIDDVAQARAAQPLRTRRPG